MAPEWRRFPGLRAPASLKLDGRRRRVGLQWVAATPKHREGQLNQVRVGFRREQLAGLEILDSFGQRSVLTFDKLQLNTGLPAASFQFKPPQGADLVRQ